LSFDEPKTVLLTLLGIVSRCVWSTHAV